MYTNQLGGADEAALQDVALQRLAERQSSHYGAPPPPSLFAAKSTASGAVKAIKFCDADTAFWQVAKLHHQDGRSFPRLGERTCMMTPRCN